VSGAEAPNRLEQHITAIDAAVDAGVERIVYTSFVGAAADSTFTLARDHWATEEHLRAIGSRFTSMRQNMYLDFMPVLAGPGGVIRGPADDGWFVPVARDDVADVAVAILTGEGHDGRAYDVTGRERLTLAEVAEQLSALTGRTVTFEDETIEQAYESRAVYGAPDFEVEGWVTSYLAIAKGELDVVSDTVRRLTGHEPLTLAEYVAARPAE
jgi:NAD(P)H dehydrogenase (quinone)